MNGRNGFRARDRVLVGDVREGDSPRSGGLREEHVRALAVVESPLPPILVHRDSMRVIDGAHRLAAARLQGRDTIDVQFFDGTPEEAFRVGVAVNVTHGLPLSLAERRAAAARLIATHPQLSNRMIATSAGLSPKTVASVRDGSGGPPLPAEQYRLGIDGRSRPVNSAERRIVASHVVADHPDASLRAIAAEAGISVSTARDVRNRVLAGKDPVPPRVRARRPEPAPSSVVASGDPRRLMEMLRRDPALRYSDSGRALLRSLEAAMGALGHMRTVAGPELPPHCSAAITSIVQSFAQMWTEVAKDLA
jgi:ParB-like chromosome segregation protein Spo0J